MGLLKGLRKLRRACYKAGRVLGDVTAVMSCNPQKVGKRVANKWLGRHVARRCYFRGGPRR